VALLLGKEVLGGLLLGVLVGLLTERVLRSMDEPNLEILITLAAVLGLNFVAGHLHLSGPLAAVVAGLMLGNQGRARAMSPRTQGTLDTVWMFIDETLNAILFLLIGVEVLAIDSSAKGHLWAALALIPATLFARWLSVAVPMTVLRIRTSFSRGTVRVLTWGGLKGGISIALAMKMPEFPGRNAILTATYGVVVFSIVVQGLSVGRLIRRLMPDAEPGAVDDGH
jgi:CPA1 family monovalent cation:H+ antiporter